MSRKLVTVAVSADERYPDYDVSIREIRYGDVKIRVTKQRYNRWVKAIKAYNKVMNEIDERASISVDVVLD